MKCAPLFSVLLWMGLLIFLCGCKVAEKDLGLQLKANPPMVTVSRDLPKPPPIEEDFEIREGFTLVTTLDEFRAAIKKDGQKIRMKPGVYRAKKTDPPMTLPRLHVEPDEYGNVPQDPQEHIFAVTGSHNYFDLRGVVIETPVSVQSRLSGKPHVADSWHINGANNTFEGGYFRNVTDMPYPEYKVTENEFEICNDNNTFLNCIFVVKGSVPYGYTDYYGNGGPNFGRVDQHSGLLIQNATNTSLIGCEIYMRSFGHAIHFRKVDGVLIKDSLISGTLRPTNDIFKEVVGRAVESGFKIMSRGGRPIPRNGMIPLAGDAVRSYEEVRNVTILNTTVERLSSCFQLLCEGDVTLEDVTVLEAGNFSYDLSSGSKGKVVMKNCRADVAYSPVFSLTGGDIPKEASYELTILSPAEGVNPTYRSGFGVICGDECSFIFHDGTTRPLERAANLLVCGGEKPLTNSIISNYTTAEVIMSPNTSNCVVKSVGPVVDRGERNTVVQIDLDVVATPY